MVMDRAIYEQAKQWVLEAGAYIIGQIAEEQEVETKADEHDVVTAVDKEVEIFFTEKIRKAYPEHRIVGEEGFGDLVRDGAGVVWYIDPIDGTKNFIHLKRDFAVSVGIVVDGAPVAGFIYDVMADVLFEASLHGGAYRNGRVIVPYKPETTLREAMLTFGHDLLIESPRFNHHVMIELMQEVRGTRRIGAASLELMAVAEGRLDGYIAKVLAPWDIAAASVILGELGLTIERADGSVATCLESAEIICVKNAIKPEVQAYMAHWLKHERG